jgi:hypothetical protein
MMGLSSVIDNRTAPGIMMSKRVATCACGQLSVTVEGDPETISACNCTWCQRRTGSPFGVAAYYRNERVAITGASKAFRRGVEGTERTLTNQFCPECGSTVYWTADLRPGQTGVAIGFFLDPDFPPPMRTVWTQHKHAWVNFPEGIPKFPRAAT